jgi:hypothetical protein
MVCEPSQQSVAVRSQAPEPILMPASVSLDGTWQFSHSLNMHLLTIQVVH